ncbi:MAG: peptide MFS transporter [Planctomycetota bacterium]
MSDAANSGAVEKTFLGHPRGLFVLFFAELWERFSYYGMRALLTLYMVKVLAMDDSASAGVYGGYTGLVYLFPVLGGYLADKVLGYRRSIILGGLLMAIGHGLMALEDSKAFYMALAFLCVGNGFFKPNISSIVGKLYKDGDERRDAGFTIFYMGINVGAMLAPLVCGYLGEDIGWDWGFGAAAIGMLIGLATFMWGTGFLQGKGDQHDPAIGKKHVIPGLSLSNVIYLGAIAFTPAIAYLLYLNKGDTPIVDYIVYSIAAVVLVLLLKLGMGEGKVALHRIYSLLILMFFHMMFWAFFEQAGSSLTLFADRVVDRTVPFFGTVSASQFQAVNPFFIILFAPFFTAMWIRLGKRQPSVPVKFALGLLQLGLGFGVLVFGMSQAGDGHKMLWFYLVLMYLLHTTGELCLSPVGLSAVTKLAPAKATGFVMGAWFLSIAMGNIVAGNIAKLTEVSFENGTALNEMTDRRYGFGKGIKDKVTIADLTMGAPKTRLLDSLRMDAYVNGTFAGAKLTDIDRTAILDSMTKVPESEAGGGKSLLSLVSELGELGISPGQVLTTALAKGHMNQASADEIREILGADGLMLSDKSYEGDAKNDHDKQLKKWIKVFAKSADLKPEDRDKAVDAIDIKSMRGAHVAMEKMGNHLVQPILDKYQPVYFWVFIVAVGVAVLLFILSPFIKKLMHGVH